MQHCWILQSLFCQHFSYFFVTLIVHSDKYSHIAFKAFFKKYSDKIQDAGFIEKSREYLDSYPLMPTQAIYVADMVNLTVTYQRGITKLLGYSEEEFNFDLLMSYYHPDDTERYFYLIKIVNEWARKKNPEPFTIESMFDYRVRKKDGSYLKVLRQTTVFESCFDTGMKSFFSILTDISRIKTDTSINFSLHDVESGNVLLENKQPIEGRIHFTKREKEILLKIKQGMNSKSIADLFDCSKHTVDTHRRKMLKKTGSKNTMELVNFSIRAGII